MSTTPTDEEFRAIGFAGAARNYPISDAAVRWLRKFNNVSADWVEPLTWHYAPNAYMQATLEANAVRDGS